MCTTFNTKLQLVVIVLLFINACIRVELDFGSLFIRCEILQPIEIFTSQILARCNISGSEAHCRVSAACFGVVPQLLRNNKCAIPSDIISYSTE